MALCDEASSKLLSAVFGQVCPTGDVLAAVQDAHVPTQEVGKGCLFPFGEPIALWGEEPFSETVESKLLRGEPQLTRLCGQCLLDVRGECDDHRRILSELKYCSVYHLTI